jgi:PhzF family phenazine biosynthesis protein
MPRVPFKTVDVFTSTPFKGNPVAVVLDAAGVSTEQMQQIASWTNLSETTFVLPATAPTANYRVRIFTPGAELPFAGHPTIGTAHALLEAGMIDADNGKLVQQCEAGLVELQVVHDNDGKRRISFDCPEPKFSALDAGQIAELEAILGVSLEARRLPCVVDVGPRWLVVQLASARDVLDSRPNFQCMKIQDIKGRHTGVVVFGKHEAGDRAGIEVRAFAPVHGVDEDPVCGSGNGCVAAYIRHTGQTPDFGNDYVATQGAMVGRAGVLRISISETAIRVGGNAITCVDGALFL